MGYESSAERWSPVQSVEKILLSVVSMLAGQYVKTDYFMETILLCPIYFESLIENTTIFFLIIVINVLLTYSAFITVLY